MYTTLFVSDAFGKDRSGSDSQHPSDELSAHDRGSRPIPSGGQFQPCQLLVRLPVVCDDIRRARSGPHDPQSFRRSQQGRKDHETYHMMALVVPLHQGFHLGYLPFAHVLPGAILTKHSHWTPTLSNLCCFTNSHAQCHSHSLCIIVVVLLFSSTYSVFGPFSANQTFMSTFLVFLSIKPSSSAHSW